MPLNLNLQQNLQALGVWRVGFFSCSIYWSIDVVFNHSNNRT